MQRSKYIKNKLLLLLLKIYYQFIVNLFIIQCQNRSKIFFWWGQSLSCREDGITPTLNLRLNMLV